VEARQRRLKEARRKKRYVLHPAAPHALPKQSIGSCFTLSFELLIPTLHNEELVRPKGKIGLTVKHRNGSRRKLPPRRRRVVRVEWWRAQKRKTTSRK
jgi:hypothetical protein